MSVKIPILTDYDARGVMKAEASLSGLQKTAAAAGNGLQAAFVPAALAAGALAVALGSSVEAAMEDAASQEQLAGVLTRTTAATSENVRQAEQFISSLSRQTATADDDLRPALARLAAATHDQTEAQKLLVISQDVAAASGKDLDTVTAALSKAYNGNFKALKMLDPSLSAVIKSGATFSETMKVLAERTGGAAAAAADTTAGRMKAFSIAIDETKETIGAALLPAVEKLLAFLQKVAQAVQDNSRIFLIATGIILGTATAIIALNVGMKAYAAAAKIAAGVQLVFNAVMSANPFVKVALVIGVVVTALVVLYKTNDAVREGFQTLARVVVQAINYIVGATGRLLQGIVNFVAGMINSIGNLVGKLGFIPGIGDEFTAASDKIKAAGSAVKDFGKTFQDLKLPSFDRIGNLLGGVKATVVKSFADTGTASGQAFADNSLAAATGAATKLAASNGKTPKAAKTATGTAASTLDRLSFKLGLNNQMGPLSGYNADSIAADKDRVKAAAEKLKAASEDASRIVGSAFATVAAKSMKAFTASTAAGLEQMAASFDTQVAGIRSRLAGQLASVNAALAATMSAIDQQEGALTPAEQALAAAEATRSQALAARTLAGAESQLAAARTTGDQADIVAAELALADVRQNQAIDALQVMARDEREAARERFKLARQTAQDLAADQQKGYETAAQAEETAAQKSYNASVMNYQAERDLQEEHLSLELEALKTSLEKQPKAWASIHDKVMTLFADSFGPDYKTAGTNMGSAFVTGLLESFGKVGEAALAATPSLATSRAAVTSPEATVTPSRAPATTVINVNGVLTEANAGQAIVNALRRFNQVTGPINIKVA